MSERLIAFVMDTFSTLTCEGREFLIKGLSSFNVSHLVYFYIVYFEGLRLDSVDSSSSKKSRLEEDWIASSLFQHVSFFFVIVLCEQMALA